MKMLYNGPNIKGGDEMASEMLRSIIEAESREQEILSAARTEADALIESAKAEAENKAADIIRKADENAATVIMAAQTSAESAEVETQNAGEEDRKGLRDSAAGRQPMAIEAVIKALI